MLDQVTGHIFLAGFMGSGKSTVGPLLARDLMLLSFDLDIEIENQSGLKVQEIFERDGEPGFRALESEALARIVGGPKAVICLGGGTLLQEKNRELILESGVVVYLRARLDTLVDRLGPEVSTRPILSQGRRMPLSTQQLRDRVAEVLRLRSPLESRCNLAVDTDGLSPVEVAQKVTAAVMGRK